MEDLKKLDSLTEFQLTNAIQKAASLAVASQDDRSQILAKQLIKDNVPKHLTKLATQAYNRRLSVITIGRRDQDTKADDFPLADFNKVASLRGCEDQSMQKKASVSGTFIFKVEKAPVMKKAASAKPVLDEPVPLSPHRALENLQAVMHKESADLQARLTDYLLQEEQLDRMVKTAAEMLNKDPKTGSLLATVYGDTYSELFTGKVPERALKKYAAYAVLPSNATVEYVEKTIEQADRVAVKKSLLQTKKASLERAVKQAQTVQGKIKEAMLQKTQAAGYNMFKDVAANAISAPINAAIAGGKGLASQTGEIASAASPFLNPERSYSPSDVLSLQLLSKDRYQDKRMRLIDMLASPQLAQYPAREIQKAVEDTIATNPDLATPRMRQYLKAEVGARLLAGNRTNRADLAAAADIVKKVTQADKNRQDMSAEKVVEGLNQSKTKGTSFIDLMPKLDLSQITNHELKLKDLGSDWQKLLAQIKEDRQAEQILKEQINEANSEALEAYGKQRASAIDALAKIMPKKDAVLDQFELQYQKRNPGAKIPLDTKGKRLPPAAWTPGMQAAFRDFQQTYFNNKDPEEQAAIMRLLGKV